MTLPMDSKDLRGQNSFITDIFSIIFMMENLHVIQMKFNPCWFHFLALIVAFAIYIGIFILY